MEFEDLTPPEERDKLNFPSAFYELRRLRKELEAKDFKILVLETTIKKAGDLYGVDIKKKLDGK